MLGAASQKVSVAQNTVLIAGPAGYCVDRTQTRDSDRGVFVLLASCASVAKNSRAAKPHAPAMLTASVSHSNNARIIDSMQRLDTYFKTGPGQAALARDGQARSVSVLRTQKSAGVYYLHVVDKSPNYQVGLSTEYWRALLDVSGRIVTLNVIGFQDNPIGDIDELATLQAFVARVQGENLATR